MRNWDEPTHFEDAMRYFAASRYNRHDQQKENTMTEKKLYQISISESDVMYATKLASVKYGHKLAVNSAGKWVMEIKGTGEVITCDKDDVEEVMPYTVSIQFQTGKQIYSYLAEKDSVELDAFYIFDAPLGRAIAQVVKLDTKSPAASVEFKPLAKLNVTLSE
jgi:hypothetical protein